ncbi:TonB-dependent receptor [Chitinophaga agrisoli]|uniref:TonB-dependent receptor n=1 Tax=Chitinophaga agrisoli TaxID=2607653 RepID=A0A5B2VII7_9BACT|nr:TonB-dependent receptor [Chitinophaga agrisoli]KAA2238734.1 TonB-dependent receptor [Chitinophaga agrisoli]
MKPIVLLLSIWSLCLSATAQISISGQVSSQQGLAIAGASVSIKGATAGATTDSSGHFHFTTKLTGKQVLRASSIGYKKQEQDILIADSGITVDIILPANHQTLGEVVISAGAFEASDKAKGASLTPMDAMTVAGNGGDIANSLRSLPGAQQVGEREGLFVRGGTSEEAKQFVDGTLLKNPNYSSVPGVLQPARINPFLFKGVLFSTGGYSAQYGQAMSSALILETMDLPDESSASLHLFPTSSGLGFQKLANNKQSSYGLNVNYGNQAAYNSIVKQRPDYFLGPEYGNAEANYRVKTSKTGMLKIYVNASLSNIGLRNPDVDSMALKSAFKLNSSNVYTNISYREMLGKDWKLQAGAAYSYNQDKIGLQLQDGAHQPVYLAGAPYAWKNRDMNTTTNFAQGRVVLSRLFSRNQALHIGAEHFYAEDRYHSGDSLYPLTDQLTAGFVEGDIYLANNLMARVGVRGEHSTLLKKSTVAPRASLAYRFGDGGQLNLAYGIFYQKPENQFLYQQRDLRFSKATHYLVNYTKKAGNRLLRLEAYYKRYAELPKTIPFVNSNGSGDAKGIELFWRDKRSIKNLDYWISYTYLDTKRDYLNYPYALQPYYATPHTASVAVKRYFENINLNVNLVYNFATGRPYYDIRSPQGNEHTQVFDHGTTRAYHNINLSGAYLFNLFKGKWKHPGFGGIGFGVNNILGTRQIFNYQYSYNGMNKIPVIPTAARSFYLGVFMSFGIDRTEDFINDNL